MTDLESTREILTYAVSDNNSAAFPGSKAYYAYRDAVDALREFDDAHPEIRKAIIAKKRAEKEAEHGAAVNRALRLAD